MLKGIYFTQITCKVNQGFSLLQENITRQDIKHDANEFFKNKLCIKTSIQADNQDEDDEHKT